MQLKRSSEHYARVERERRLGEPFFVALIRVAYEDIAAQEGSDAAAWALLGYIHGTAARPAVDVAVDVVAAPVDRVVVRRRGPSAHRGRPLSEEHKAKLRAAWERRRDAASRKAPIRFPAAEL